METPRTRYAEGLSRSLYVATNEQDLYACPLCLSRFTSEQWKELTWDHYPPQSIGGRDKHVALVCENCRKTWERVDAQLDRLKQLEEHRARYPGKTPVIVTSPDIPGWRHRESLGIEEDGALGLLGRPEDNAKGATRRVIEYMTELGTKGGNLRLHIESDTRFDYEHGAVGRAFLKAAYLAAFNRLGYPYILSQALAKVQLQMRRPDIDVPVGRVFQVTPQINISPTPPSRDREVMLAYVHSPSAATGLVVTFLGYHLAGDHIVFLPLPAYPQLPKYKSLLEEITEAQGIQLVVIGDSRDMLLSADLVIVGEDGREWPIYRRQGK